MPTNAAVEPSVRCKGAAALTESALAGRRLKVTDAPRCVSSVKSRNGAGSESPSAVMPSIDR